MVQSHLNAFGSGAGSAAHAYGSVIRRTESSRAIEYRVFSQVTAAMESADDAGAHFTDRIRAAHRNRELWQTLAIDLADDRNGLPVGLRARLISLAIWVTRETDRVLRHQGPLTGLIQVNRSVMLGLHSPAS